MARPSLAEKDILNPSEAIEYFVLSRRKFYDLLNNTDGEDFLAYYGERKLILRVTGYISRTIIRKPACIPCTDSGYAHSFSVCLMFTTLLDIPFSPQMQFLLFLSRYLPLHLQILEHDHIRMVFFGIFYDRTCNFSSHLCIQTFRICPSSP